VKLWIRRWPKKDCGVKNALIAERIEKILRYGNVENDGKEIFQVVDCTVCEKHFPEVYSYCRVILTDYPEKTLGLILNCIDQSLLIQLLQ
jgi:hypothetical protein